MLDQAVDLRLPLGMVGGGLDRREARHWLAAPGDHHFLASTTACSSFEKL
jgi:hypothetical protein